MPSIVIKNALVIFVVEVLVMQFLPRMTIESYFVATVIDAILLAAISSPLIYLWVIKPYIQARDLAQRQSEMLKNMADALHRSEQHFAAFLSASPVGMFETNREGNFTYVNRRWSEISGLSFERAKNDDWEQMLHPEDRDRVIREWAALVTGQRPFSLEFRFMGANGGITWVFGQAEEFCADSGELLGFIGTMTDITEKKKSEEVMWRQANFDLLTGLPNRLLFFDRLSKSLSQARRGNKRVALIYLDLDGFKPINDDYGHLAGDAVLRVVAQRWLICVREVDTIARMGGDEFAVILGDLEDSSEAAIVAEKLLKGLVESIALPDGQNCRVGASVGISVYPDNGTEMDSLLAAADIAMYESKSKGKNVYTVFSPSLSVNGDGDWIVFDKSYYVGVTVIDEQHRELVRMINHLTLALRNNEGDEAISHRFNEMVEFTTMHFQTEYSLMDEYHYPEQESHRKEHDRLMLEIPSLVDQLHHGNELLILQAIKDWLLNHILTDDKYLSVYLRKQGVR